MWRPQVLAASFAPYLSAFGVPAAALLLRDRRPWSAAVALGIASAGLIPHLPARRRPIDGPTTRPILTVLTANLLHGRADPRALPELAARSDIDVLLLHEFTFAAGSQLTALGIGAAYPYSIVEPRSDGGGTALFSRFPIEAPVVHLGLVFAGVSALILGPGGSAVRAVAVHPSPPWPLPLADHLADFRRLEHLLDRPHPGPRIDRVRSLDGPPARLGSPGRHRPRGVARRQRAGSELITAWVNEAVAVRGGDPPRRRRLFIHLARCCRL